MSPGTRRGARIAVQVVGFAACVAALVWCVRAALSPTNRGQLARLLEAPWWMLGGMVGLTAASLVLNGLVFRATLRPVHRLRVADMLAVNAVATFLAYLPFKLSMLARVVIHNRRDGLPVTLVAGWFAAVAAVLLVTVLPPAAASLWRGRIDAAWWVASVGGVVAMAAVMVVVARVLGRHIGTESGTGRKHKAQSSRHKEEASAEPDAGSGDTAALEDSRAVAPGRQWHVLRGLRMLADGRVVAETIGYRVLDTAGQAARFNLAAAVLGVPLAAEQAVIISVSFFLIGIVSPAGMLGVREAGATGLAGLLAVSGSAEFAAVSLLVGATEAVTNLGGALVGLAWLRPDRLLGGKKPPPS